MARRLGRETDRLERRASGAASATFANTISLSASGATATIAAAPGATLSLTGALTLAGANTIDIGAPGQNGDIL
jgi:hypothetical protein